MITAILVGLALVAVPVALVVALLFLLGSAVVGLTDGAVNGLTRPNPS